MMPPTYNANLQILQTGRLRRHIPRDDSRRSNHPALTDVRTSHQASASSRGDSVGHWEGETLVVDTTNFTGKTTLSEERRAQRGRTSWRAMRCTWSSGSRPSIGITSAISSLWKIPQHGRAHGQGKSRCGSSTAPSPSTRATREITAPEHPSWRARGREGKPAEF